MVDQGELENTMICEWKKYANYKINQVNNEELPMQGLYNCYDCMGINNECPNYIDTKKMSEIRYDLVNGDYR